MKETIEIRIQDVGDGVPLEIVTKVVIEGIRETTAVIASQDRLQKTIKNHQENLEVGTEMIVDIKRGHDPGRKEGEDVIPTQDPRVTVEIGNIRKVKSIRRIRRSLRSPLKEKNSERCKPD